MSSAPNVFTVVNDESLSRAVAATRGTVVYVAPGITKPVVDCLAKQLDSQPNLLATVIVDLDPEVYRLGYGTEEDCWRCRRWQDGNIWSCDNRPVCASDCW